MDGIEALETYMRQMRKDAAEECIHANVLIDKADPDVGWMNDIITCEDCGADLSTLELQEDGTWL